MLPPNKRLNYFDHQFLRRDDFADEQAYHLGMRRAHNRMLHTPGVAQGLVVEPSGGGVTVSEGVAIDAEGRELVLDDDAARDLSSVEGSPLWITFVYREEPTDRTNETGAEGDRRWAERGEVGVTATPPANDGMTLVLARVTRDGEGVLKIDDGEGAVRRRPASAVGGEMSAATLEVRGAARAASLAVTGALAADDVAATSLNVSEHAEVGSLAAGAARLGETDVAGTLSAETAKLGETGVTGDLTVAGALKVGKDASVDGSVLARGDGRFGGRVTVGGAAGDAPLHVAGGNGNVLAGEGDFKIGNATIRLKMGIGIGANNGDARIQAQGGNARLMLGTAGADVVQIQNSGVGVSTPPLSAGGLTVAGSIHLIGGNVAAADRRLYSPGDGILRWQVPATAPARAFEVGLTNGQLPIRFEAAGPSFITGGFLGVGVNAPEATLHVIGGRDAVGGEGDLKIGYQSNRLKVGVATAGPTAGEARLRAEGTAPRILLGAGGADMVNVAPTGVGIGAGVAPLAGTVLNVGGAINATEFLKNGAALTSQWADVPGQGISYAAGGVGVGRAPLAGVRLAVEGGIGFGSSAAPMLYIWESPGTAERAVAAHSPGFPTWGLFYRDVDDRMIFRGNGAPVLTADLGGRRVGVGTDAPAVAMHVVGNRIRLQHPTVARSIELRADGNATDLQSDGAPLFLHTGPTAPFQPLIMNPWGGPVAMGTETPIAARLTVAGTNAWDLTNTDGDMVIGNAAYKLKFGIALGGGGAGMSGIRSTNRLTLGVGNTEALYVDANQSAFVYGNLSCLTLSIRSGAKPGYVFDHFVNQTGDPVEQGDVVVIGGSDATEFWATESNIPIPEVDLASTAYDTRVCGIVEKVVTEGELPYAEMREVAKPRARRGRGKKAADEAPEDAAHPLGRYAAPDDTDRKQVGPGQLGNMVTMGAFAHCKVDADIAPIQAGDLLTTSPTRGHAQKVLDPAAAVGAIVGKALGSLESGRGKIPVLVMLQ